FPPVPADVAVVLGAFLARQGTISAPLLGVLCWFANTASAAGMYFYARAHGRRFFASGWRRKLMPPEAIAALETAYRRHGMYCIFISRFLPGFRAVVPPFAGLVGLGAWRTLVPMGIASAIWYGGITLLGVLIGSNWERILAIIAGVNRTLGILTAVVIVGVAVWAWKGRRQRAKERVWHATRDALDPAAPSFLAGTEIAEGSARETAAMLLLELAYADPALTPVDRDLVASHLRDRWGLSAGGSPPDPAPEEERQTRFSEYAGRLRQRFGQTQRLELVERMWAVAFSDSGALSPHEDRLMFLASELLSVGPAEVAELRRRLRAQQQA
ncbi:MAG: TerB family tellurite resistance protein, partial [Gemmatimonadales bacterium]